MTCPEMNKNLADLFLESRPLTDEARKHIASYKLPKAIVRRSAILRSPAGKADYRWATAAALDEA